MDTLKTFHLPNCHNCLQSALYQLQKPADKRNVDAAIAAIKAAQKNLAQAALEAEE